MKINILLYNISIYLFTLLFLFLLISCDGQKLKSESVYEEVINAVVVIHAYNDNNKLTTQGSGVVLNDKGYVVTNYHVLSGNSRLEILHGEEIVPYVDIIGIDVEKDILILKIENKKFPAIKIGNSKSLKIGQRIYTIGSPMGLENTISEGIISGLRSFDESRRTLIQMTASISSGSSGGAVVNDKGELIGISTLTTMEGQNLNFAIPIDDILNVEISSYSKNDAYKDFELFNKGRDAGRKRNYQEAIKYYSQYIYKFPNDAAAYNNRGNSKNELEDYRGAIQDYNKAIEINPNDANAYYNRGTTKDDLEDYRGAIQDFNKAIEINPNYANAYINCGSAKIKLEDCRGAIQDLNKAIEINPDDAAAYNFRGIAKAQLEDYRSAIQDLNKAIEINPNFSNGYLNRGTAKYFLKDRNGACLDWSKAGELGLVDAYDFIKKHCN